MDENGIIRPSTGPKPAFIEEPRFVQSFRAQPLELASFRQPKEADFMFLLCD